MGAKAGTCGLPSEPPGAGVKPEPGVLGVLSMFGSSLLLAREASLAVHAVNDEMDDAHRHASRRSPLL